MGDISYSLIYCYSEGFFQREQWLSEKKSLNIENFYKNKNFYIHQKFSNFQGNNDNLDTAVVHEADHSQGVKLLISIKLSWIALKIHFLVNLEKILVPEIVGFS